MTTPEPDLAALVDTIPGPEGWWHESNAETYRALAARLSGLGVPDDAAVSILASAYGAAVDECGG